MKHQLSQSTVPLWGMHLSTCTLLGALLCGLLSQSALTAAPLPDAGDNFKGKPLAAWQQLYQRWAFGDMSLPPDSLGNAVVDNTVLMPTPSTPGDGTPGQIDVTIRTGQGFMLPLWGVLGTSYTDIPEVDPPILPKVFTSLDITFKIDGQVVVTGASAMKYYSKFDFNPEIELVGWGEYKALVWFQGVGLLRPPLAPGNHTMQLDVKNTQPVVDAKGRAFTYEYHNTWNLQVVGE